MRNVPLAIALAAIGAWLCTALIVWSQGAPLGHDEAQYALAARDMLAGEPIRWFYVSRGMNAMAAPGLWLGGDELALRLVPMIGGVGFVLATWWLARRAVGAASAAWALVVLAGARSVVRRSTDLLSDMPAAACLIAALAVIIDEIDRAEGARWRLVLVAPLLSAAMYVRYGSAVPIAVIVVASIAVGWRTLARRPAPVIVTALLFLALLVPHFVWAYQTTGSPLGILLASRSVPHQAHVYEGLVTYVTSNPLQYYGIGAAVAMIAGVMSFQTADRRALLVWLVAVGSLIGMGLTTHAMSRYVMTSIVLLVVLGSDRLARGIFELPAVARRVVSAGVILALVAVWMSVTIRQLDAGEYRRRTMRGTLTAVDVIRRDAAGEPCIVIGYNSTPLEWYSGCVGPQADPRGRRVYVVRDRTPGWITGRQPEVSDVPGTPVVLFALPELDVTRVDVR